MPRRKHVTIIARIIGTPFFFSCPSPRTGARTNNVGPNQFRSIGIVCLGCGMNRANPTVRRRSIQTAPPPAAHPVQRLFNLPRGNFTRTSRILITPTLQNGEHAYVLRYQISYRVSLSHLPYCTSYRYLSMSTLLDSFLSISSLCCSF